MTERLFSVDDFVEVPLMPPTRKMRVAPISDERLGHDYPPEWNRCPACNGSGRKIADVLVGHLVLASTTVETDEPCPTCIGMGSVKARVRLEAGHRCVRCGHPYMPKGDAKMLGIDPSPYQWSPCDERCTHSGPIRYRFATEQDWLAYGRIAEYGWTDVTGYSPTRERLEGAEVEAEWRILTVHHADGDKANLAWWNLLSLCQRCHLEIQGRVVMDRVYPHRHSPWFQPYAAGFYAKVYLGEELTRDETVARLDELLSLERMV